MGASTKEQILDDEGLATLLCKVESIVNGRLVTEVSDVPRCSGIIGHKHCHMKQTHMSNTPALILSTILIYGPYKIHTDHESSYEL